MSGCCVFGCKNRHSSTNQTKFYRIPSGNRPFQANRRRLWLKAIQQVNGGSTEKLRGNARICSAHFISGEASMDHGSPDFVPSVFASTKPKQNLKKKTERSYDLRKRQQCSANEEEKGETATPPRDNSPVDQHSSVLTEDTETLSSPSVPKEGETLTEEVETKTETRTINSQTTSRQNTISPSFKLRGDFPMLDKRIPVVLLKPVFAPAGEYQCELCNQHFSSASQLVKHKQMHEEKSFICETCGKVLPNQADFTEHKCVPEQSFPCNICDRSFTTSHNLKRHKLLHVKDDRKCGKCGVFFCRRHNHVVFTPQTESEQESYMTEPQDSDNLDNNLTQETSLPKKPELNQTADLDDHAQSTMTSTPLLTTTIVFTPPNPGLLPRIHTVKIARKVPVQMSRNLSSMPRPPPPGPRLSRNNHPKTSGQPHLPKNTDLPSSRTNLPSSRTNLPSSLTNLPSSRTNLPSSLTNLPSSLTNLPPSRTNLPPSLTNLPSSRTNLPSSLTNLPSSLTNLPSSLPNLPPSLRIFSPQYLTSALLEVRRDYKYILSKARDVKKKLVKEEECELPLVPPVKQDVKQEKKERTAYDLEIVL